MTKRKNTSIRLGDALEKLLADYSAFIGSDRSKVIREGLTEWLFQKMQYVQFERLRDYLAKRNPFNFMKECERCSSNENLVVFYIDGNVNNTASDNLITLCKQCLIAFEVFRLKQNVKEKFVEWFFSTHT
jgi:predicted DNA-binding protein